MLRLNENGDGDCFHQAFVASAGDLLDLRAGLERLRTMLDATGIEEFFLERTERYEAEVAALTVTLDGGRAAEWRVRLCSVLPDFGNWPDWLPAGTTLGAFGVRQLGWLRVESVLGRLEALLRLPAPPVVVEAQRRELRQALRVACGQEQYLRAPPDFTFWAEARFDEIEPQQRELLVVGHAQELIERCIELCIEPLVVSAGLGADVHLALEGEPLVGCGEPAAHWYEPLAQPCYLVGSAAQRALAAPIAAGPGASADLQALEARFRAAANRCVTEGAALLWWWQVDV